MNVLIVNSSQAYEDMFKRYSHELVYDIKHAELVCFTGGEDVSPELYGDKKHYSTGNSLVRDLKEKRVYEMAIELNIPMVGVCRGGQFLNVMNGGRMYQDVEKHCWPHEITDLQTGETILVSSTHHQMMMPSPEAVLLASSHLSGAREWFDGVKPRSDVSNCDYEVVYYANTRSLCFQPHPEFNNEQYNRMTEYFFELLAKVNEESYHV